MMSNVSKTRDGLSHRDLWVKIMSSITLGDDKELQGTSLMSAHYDLC